MLQLKLDEKYPDMEKLFESWNRRELFIFVKYTIINTLALYRLIYIANILELPDKKFIKDTNRLIYNFLCNKTDRTKTNTLYGNILDGGFGIL